MQPRLKMSRQGLELLKGFEGLRPTAARLPDGRWTIGHGHTQYAREGAEITAADAEALLLYDLIPVVAVVNQAVTVEISQNQFDALACFAFNVGAETFRQSEVLARVNQERMTEAALAMAIWRSGAFDGRRVVLDALVRRRSAEEALMLGDDGRPAPSDLIRPEIDPAAEASLPSSSPAGVEVDFAAGTAEARLVEADAAPTPEPMDAPASDTPEPSSAGPETGEAEIAAPADDGGAAGQSDASEPAVIAAEPEAIVHAPPQDDDGALRSASVSTRLQATYPPEPFAPLQAAQSELDDSIPLNIAPDADPAVSSDSAEPPLVLVLTPPPEVSSEPPASFLTDEASAEPEEQAVLFDGSGPEAAVDEGVLYYEPQPGAEGRSARWSDMGAFVTTGVVGLTAFGFGIAGFHLAGDYPVQPGAFDEKTAIAWVLVAIGVICVWISAYNLFKRLGGPEPE